MGANRNNNEKIRIYEVSIKEGYPTVDTAMRYVEQTISLAKAYGCPAVKLIHGYGSSGIGGRIKAAVQRKLGKYKSMGKIREFTVGENFSPFDSATQRMIAAYPDITRDRDYFKTNQGITIVLM